MRICSSSDAVPSLSSIPQRTAAPQPVFGGRTRLLLPLAARQSSAVSWPPAPPTAPPYGRALVLLLSRSSLKANMGGASPWLPLSRPPRSAELLSAPPASPLPPEGLAGGCLPAPPDLLVPAAAGACSGLLSGPCAAGAPAPREPPRGREGRCGWAALGGAPPPGGPAAAGAPLRTTVTPGTRTVMCSDW